MTKTEYMDELRFKLSNADKELFDEIINDYEAHFTEGLASGKSEDEICCSLGSIDDLVIELGVDVPEAEAVSINNDDYDRIDTVFVQGLNADVKVLRSTNGRLGFDYNNYGSMKQQAAYSFEPRKEGNVVYAEVKKNSTKSFFFSSLSSPSIDLVVYIPESMKLVDVKSMSGDISAIGISAESVVLGSASGDVDASQIKANAIKLASTSGDLRIDPFEANDLNMTTVSGDIRVTCNTASNLSLESTSGDISAASKCPCTANLKSISGDIDMKLMQTDGYTADVATVSGDIELYYKEQHLGCARKGNYTFAGGESHVIAKSVSGDVTIKA